MDSLATREAAGVKPTQSSHLTHCLWREITAPSFRNARFAAAMTVRYHREDLPADYAAGASIAVDTETLGLSPLRDRLCVVQISNGDGHADVVQIRKGQALPLNLARVMGDASVLKIFHFARFDLAVLFHALGVMPTPVYCTKIASKLTRTYTDRHGLKDLTRELLGIDLSKQQQSSDWAAEDLTEAQLEYAASDVLHLHMLKARLDAMLEREDRADLARACFEFLPTRARLDLAGWPETDIFAHS
jgi:ribonuclease D